MVAHGPDVAGFTKTPDMEKECSSCHSDIIDNFPLSKHAMFNDLTSEDDEFVVRAALHVRRVSDDQEKQGQMAEAIDHSCAVCHRTTCGSCHITLPAPAHGGFPNTGHLFFRPNLLNNCTACHGGRKYPEFMADIPSEAVDESDILDWNPERDVHYSEYDLDCVDCHGKSWMHENTTDMTKKLRYEDEALPTCEGCHLGDEATFFSNAYHSQHSGEDATNANLQCQVCHAQPSPDCLSCHVDPDVEGEPPPDCEFYTTKIALNPFVYSTWYADNLPNLGERYPYEYSIVRRATIVRDTFDKYGSDILSNFTAYPTWKFGSPHNIQKITPQTKDGCNSCHGHSEFFLTEDYLEKLMTQDCATTSPYLADELEANSEILVAEIPSSR